MNGRPGDYRNFVHKRIFGGIKGFATGGIRGAIGGFITSGGRSSKRAVQPRAPKFVPLQQTARLPRQTTRTTSVGPFGSIFKRTTTQRFQAKARVQRFHGVEAEVSTSRAPAVHENGACPTCNGGRARATHFNKSGYYVQSEPGNPAAGGTWIAAGSACVPNRSRNAGNGRAVVRATSRIASFDRLAKRVRKQMKAACR